MKNPIDYSDVSFYEFEAIIMLDDIEKQFAEMERSELVKTLFILKSAFIKK
jgi:hypothetical protein